MSPTTKPQPILLVEDDVDYSDLLHQAFADAGFQTLQAGDGEKALQMLRKEPVSLVVSDFIMPELNGLELCRLVNSDVQLSQVRVVLYSCNTDTTFRQKARELGALAYLIKTDDPEALVRQICAVAGLENRPAPAAGGPRTDLGEVAVSVRRLRVLFDSLLDFLQIAAVTDPSSPIVQLAWDAAQRHSSEIKQTLKEMEKGIQELEPVTK